MDDDFADFYRDAYPGAVRLAWLLTHDHAAAEDVVQDAFVRVRPRLDAVSHRTAYLRTAISQGVMLDLRTQLFERLLDQSLGEVTDRRSGDAMSRISNDVAGVEGVVSDTVFGMAETIVVGVIGERDVEAFAHCDQWHHRVRR